MTLRISQFAAACGLGLLTLPGFVLAQAPRYQSPYSSPVATPAAPAALPAPPAITPNGTVVEDVVVRVNDQIISRSDLERSQQQLIQGMQQQGNVNAADSADQEKNLLRDMIDQQLLLSRAKELGLNADAELTRRLDEIRKQNKLDSMEDLEKAARSQGVSYEDFKSNIKNGILTQQVVRDEVGRHLQMTQGQEQAYYDAHKQEFEQPEQVRLSEILIPTAADAPADVVAQAQAKAADVATKVKAGGKFEDLAKTVSGGPTASQGGDLGQFKRGALAKVLEDQTFSLQAGESTAPIRTRQGFVILKVTRHINAGIPALKEVEPQIQEAMYVQAMQPALRAFLTKLREGAYIDIKPGFVDSGASSKQTKPIFSAYAAPVVKKKKVYEKQRFDRGGRFSAARTGGESAAPAALPTGTAAPAATSIPALPAAGVSAPAETAVPGTTPTATPAPETAPVTTASRGKVIAPGKPKKIKKEKVRFGQAPRNSLPSAPTDLADAGLGKANRDDAAGPGLAAAPGAAILTPESAQFSSTSDPDPLAPKTPTTGKVRYSSRAKTIAATKAAAKTVKAKEKAIATPVAASTEEKASQRTQAAPLGLNGDTKTKKKKVREKGAPKERLQQQPKQPAATPIEATPYRTPTGLTDAPRTAPSSDGTALPPATSPTPGSPQQGTTPATPGSPIPTPQPN